VRVLQPGTVVVDLARVEMAERFRVIVNQVGQQVVNGEGPICVLCEQVENADPDGVAESLCLIAFDAATVASIECHR
jgi:hypothetical protein